MSWLTDIVMPIPSMIAGWLSGFGSGSGSGSVINNPTNVYVDEPATTWQGTAETAIPWVIGGLLVYALASNIFRKR